MFFRYILSNSLGWSGEVARYLCIWLSFIGSAILNYKKGHVGLEFVTALFPKGLKKFVGLVNNLLIFIFLVYAVYFGVKLCGMQTMQRSSALLMPMSIPYFSVPVGCALMSLSSFHHIVQDFVYFFYPQTVKEG